MKDKERTKIKKLLPKYKKGFEKIGILDGLKTKVKSLTRDVWNSPEG